MPTRRWIIAIGSITGLILPLQFAAPNMVSAAEFATLRGNTPSALIAASTNPQPASSAATISLFVGFNFQTPSSGYPKLSQYIQDTETPGSQYFHHFLSASQFTDLYAPSSTQVAALLNYLAAFHITPVTVNGQPLAYPLGINLTGSVGEVARAFHVSINHYNFGGRSYLANGNNPSLPENYAYQGQTYNLAALVSAIAGMSTYNGLSTHMVSTPKTLQTGQTQPVGYSPAQMATAYNVNPLYAQHVTGLGTTIAVATLAPFIPQDASHFWRYYHIHRTGSLSEVGVAGQQVTQSGYGIGGSETSLDVERSGALAPGANLIVYEAPNTTTGFINLFEAVVSQDRAQVMTTSWGESEFFVPFSYAYLINQAFMQGAAEGMTMLAASGDNGAYDGYPADKHLSVDFPASSPDVLAAGGTTLPHISATNTNPITPGTTATGTIPIPQGSIAMRGEQGWGWSYLLPYYANFGVKTASQWRRMLFPVGSTGGSSALFTAQSPVSTNSLYGWWQHGTPNPGARNVPDVAWNADPFTGYAIYDTNSVYTSPNAGWTSGWGGTSFAAPQWAGTVALLDQFLGGRQGLINPALYANAQGGGFHDVIRGNNWYYSAGPGWDFVTGLGTPNVAQLATSLEAWNQTGH